ncbi:hypothetical protein [Nocardia brasiliensis]|uniref:hypothetical protein n=1 Tax=Nocardia brasiliensis TaxID=37326 RepID=UPI00366F02D3
MSKSWKTRTGAAAALALACWTASTAAEATAATTPTIKPDSAEAADPGSGSSGWRALIVTVKYTCEKDAADTVVVAAESADDEYISGQDRVAAKCDGKEQTVEVELPTDDPMGRGWDTASKVKTVASLFEDDKEVAEGDATLTIEKPNE